MVQEIVGRLVGRLHEPLGDMPGLVVGDNLLVFGGGCGQEVRDAILSVDPQTGTSTQVGQMPYSSRGHQVVEVKGDLYVLGGFDGATRSDLWRLDLASGTCDQLMPMPNSNAWFSAACHHGTIVVVGGYSIPDGYLAGIWVYDPRSNTWVVRETEFDITLFPRGRLGSNVLVSYGDYLISCGGSDEFDNNRGRANALGLTCSYNTTRGSWQAWPQGIQPREGLAAAQIGDIVYLVGGMSEDSDEASTMVEEVNLATRRVRRFAQLTVGRLTPAVGVIGNRLVVVGGVTKPLFTMTDTIESLVLGE